jgi:hypothetical protein
LGVLRLGDLKAKGFEVAAIDPAVLEFGRFKISVEN